MPGSLPEDGDFERFYNESKVAPGEGTTEAEAYKRKVKEELDDEDDEEGDEFPDRDQDEEAGEGDDFGDQLDFSSVPVSYTSTSLPCMMY